MKAYKLFRIKANGDITSLFINKGEALSCDEWMEAECLPTKGFKVRSGFHCVDYPRAPHLATRGRAWLEVEIEDFEELPRPKRQGGLWYIAKRMRIPTQTVKKL